MKLRVILICFVFFVFITACQTSISSSASQAQSPISSEKEEVEIQEDPLDVINSSFNGVPDSEIFDIPWQDRTVFHSNLVPEAQHWADELPLASLYRIELMIPESVDILKGREEVLYTNQEEVALAEIYLRLFPNVNGGALSLENLRVGGQSVEYYFESGDSAVRIPLESALLPGESALLQLNFTLEIPREMGGNFGLFGFFENTLVLDMFYPAIPAYDEGGWYAEPPPPNGDNSYYDASFYLLRIIAPEDFVLVASGVEVDRTLKDGVQTVTLAAGPARDISLAASRDFTVLSKMVGETKINSYAFPQNESAQKLALEVAQKALVGFSQQIGEFDYSEFDVIATPMLAGGVEYPGVTWINMDYYDLEKEFYGLPAASMLESVVAHEMVHQWFYNAVGNSQVDEAWLDESLAQYLTGQYYLNQYGEDAFRSYKSSWYYRWGRIDYKEVPIGLPSEAYEGYEYVASVYGRGPFFFEALSEQMGVKAFDDFLQDYYGRFHWQISTGVQMKQMLEEHCQCDLSKIFQEWVYPQ